MTVTAPPGHDIMDVMARRALPSCPDPVRVAWTDIDDPREAAQHLFRALDPQTLAGVLIFCSSRYPLEALADAINACSEGLTVIGCTSSGEITADGTAEGTISAIGFPASSFTLTATRFDNLDAFAEDIAQGVVR